MSEEPLRITERERVALRRIASAPRSTRAHATRAEIVLACARMGVADAARHTGVSFHTARKWKQRFEADRLDGLDDAPRPGRPTLPADVTRSVLTQTLHDPPSGRWTTRTIADAVGISQTTVSRIRREAFASSQSADEPILADQSVLLAYVHVGPDGRILGFHSPAATRIIRRRRPSAAVTDPLETVLCASLVAAVSEQPFTSASTTTSLLNRAMEGAPTDRGTTLLLDFPPDRPAKLWLARHPRIDAVVEPPKQWLTQLHTLSRTLDDRQAPELAEVQRLLRQWYRNPRGPFEWSRNERIFGSEARAVTRGYSSVARTSESAIVIRGLLESFADGTLHPGRPISERRLAQRVELSRGAVTDGLRQLVDDGLVAQDEEGRRFVPPPTERDIVETYTARALLGAALIRRLASRPDPLPDIIDAIMDEVTHQARKGDTEATGSVDLELQDELARAAHMPRIEAMFLRLTLQIRLFVTILGLTYQYPKDDIVGDGVCILIAIRAKDVDAAVGAWRRKEDNAALYMTRQLKLSRR